MRRLEELEYISVAEAKARLSEKLRSVTGKGRRYAITSHGRPKAVIIDYKEYIALLEKEGRQGPKVVSIDKLEKNSVDKKKVIESISSLFNEKKLKRKGQKRYKRDAVKKITKNKK